MPHHLVGPAEIARLLGVSRQRVNVLAASDESFPEPLAELSGGRVWSRRAIERWDRRRRVRMSADRVIAYVRKNHGVQIGSLTAAELIRLLGTDEALHANEDAQIRGREASGSPRTLIVTAAEIREACS